MKLTSTQLRQIIKEEVAVLSEASDQRPYPTTTITTRVLRAGKTVGARIVAIDEQTKERKELAADQLPAGKKPDDFGPHMRLAAQLARELKYVGILVYSPMSAGMARVGEYTFLVYRVSSTIGL